MNNFTTHLTKPIFSGFILALTIGVSGSNELQAKPKEPFPYLKPDVDRWIKYCKRHHSNLPLADCCERREAVCDNRCSKVGYPNTAYENIGDCQRDCIATESKCKREAAAILRGAIRQTPGTGRVQQTPPSSPYTSPFNIQTFKRQFSLRSRGIENLPPPVIPDPIPPALPNFELEKKKP